ncbi:MAG: nuclear transport factor 2 family protein [Flavobacteriales bacterium]|nr:nuclear transport factor 2 family protein [Flavobacteriales bacterium]
MSTSTETLTTKQVADRLVSLCQEGKFEDAIRELYAPNIVSLEPEGGNAPPKLSGFDNVIGKTKQFNEMIEEHHGVKVSDPIVANDHFAVAMEVDCTFKGMGRMTMSEICNYKVQDGKVVWEQFHFSVPPKS